MNSTFVLALLTLLTAMAAAVAAGQTVHVTDGDTIKLSGTTYRLWGIDGPETKQWCGDYPAGVQATATLEYLMKGRAIACEDRGYDRYGRTICLCRADGRDLGADMVRLGMASAHPQMIPPLRALARSAVVVLPRVDGVYPVLILRGRGSQTLWINDARMDKVPKRVVMHLKQPTGSLEVSAFRLG